MTARRLFNSMYREEEIPRLRQGDIMQETLSEKLMQKEAKKKEQIVSARGGEEKLSD